VKTFETSLPAFSMSLTNLLIDRSLVTSTLPSAILL
jgi:hypothetical protein